MYKFIFLFVFLLFVQICIAQKIKVNLYQNGVKIPIVNNTAVLKKEEFEVRVKFNNKVGKIYFNASYDDKYFKTQKNGDIPDLEVIQTYKVAEYPFNPEKKIFIENETFHYLGPEYFYKGNKIHNYSTLFQKRNHCLGIRKIDKFDDRIEKISIQHIDKQLYLFAVAFKPDLNKNFYLDKKNVINTWKVKVVWQ